MPAPLAFGIKFINVRRSATWDIFSENAGESATGIPGNWSGSQALISFLDSIVNTVEEEGLAIHPLSGVLKSDLPSGAGLSSSTALTSVILAALQNIGRWTVTRKDMMFLAQKVERNMGIECGIMDQYCLWKGVSRKAVMLDCQSLKHSVVELHVPDYQWHILFSGVKHQLLGSPYNERKQQLFQGIQSLEKQGWSINELKRPDPEMLEYAYGLEDPVIRKRLTYVMEENARVQSMSKAIRDKDSRMIGEILNAAQDGLRQKYEVSCDEIDILVDLIRDQAPDTGVRMVGGGFGGALIVFHPEKNGETALKQALNSYHKKTGRKGNILPLRLGSTVDELS